MIAVIFAALSLAQPMACNVPLTQPTPVPTSSPKVAASPAPPNGAGLLYTGADFKPPFELRATMTLPKSPTNKGLFYSNWLLLASQDSKSFVQIEVMRWKKFGYRNEIALTWAESDGTLRYFDTPVFVADGAHNLSIGVNGDAISLRADNNVTCAAQLSYFYSLSERLYMQIGTEVSGPGDSPTGQIWNIRASDATHPLQAVTPRCLYHGYGLSLDLLPDGRYAARGTFDLRAGGSFLPHCNLDAFRVPNPNI